jgi:hypothetical protein
MSCNRLSGSDYVEPPEHLDILKDKEEDLSKIKHVVCWKFTKMMMDNFPTDLFKHTVEVEAYKNLRKLIRLADEHGYEWDKMKFLIVLE